MSTPVDPVEHGHHIVGPKTYGLILARPDGADRHHNRRRLSRYGRVQPHRGAWDCLPEGSAGHSFLHAHPLQLAGDDAHGRSRLLHLLGANHHDAIRLHQPQLGPVVKVLYQGPTLVGPQRIERELGFSPCSLPGRREDAGDRPPAERSLLKGTGFSPYILVTRNIGL